MDNNEEQLTFQVKLQNGSRAGEIRIDIRNDETGLRAPRLVVASKLDKGKKTNIN